MTMLGAETKKEMAIIQKIVELTSNTKEIMESRRKNEYQAILNSPRTSSLGSEEKSEENDRGRMTTSIRWLFG